MGCGATKDKCPLKNGYYIQEAHAYYRSGTVNSKSFVGKILLRIKWKFELTVYFKHGILGKL